jgi:hypothetical protein
MKMAIKISPNLKLKSHKSKIEMEHHRDERIEMARLLVRWGHSKRGAARLARSYQSGGYTPETLEMGSK